MRRCARSVRAFLRDVSTACTEVKQLFREACKDFQHTQTTCRAPAPRANVNVNVNVQYSPRYHYTRQPSVGAVGAKGRGMIKGQGQGQVKQQPRKTCSGIVHPAQKPRCKEMRGAGGSLELRTAGRNSTSEYERSEAFNQRKRRRTLA
jgi:hypothetical protein